MIVFHRFERRTPRAQFDCGEPTLNAWLREQAGQMERANAARTRLGMDEGTGAIASFYSLAATQLEPDRATEFRAGHRRYPLSGMLIARLAVDVRFQGRGVGVLTLAHAMQTLAEVAERAAFEVVVVDAINSSAVAFYRQFGFEPLTDDGLRLVLPTTRLLRHRSRESDR